jgi:DNA-binding LacI/PurR family transcriptional regulator
MSETHRTGILAHLAPRPRPQPSGDPLRAMVSDPFRRKATKTQALSTAARLETRTIGLVLPMGHETGQRMTDSFLMEMIGHLTEEVIHRGYDMLFSKIAAPRKGWLPQLVQSGRFDGLLMLGQSDQHGEINDLAGQYLPMVVWGERLPGQAYCSLGVDNVYGGRAATEHLLGLGRQSIRFLGPVHVPEVDSRYRGYLQAMAQAPHSLLQAGVVTDPIACSFTHQSAYEAMHEALSRGEKIDALFCASDVIAGGARMAIVESRLRVPDDIALVGFDDVAMAQNMSPPLSTVKQDLEIAARSMVDMLFRRMSGEETPSSVIPARLMIRESTVGARPV